MIALLGDIHGDAAALRMLVARSANAGASCIIQLGDFGVYPSVFHRLTRVAKESPIPIYFIDGNHEDHAIIEAWPCEAGKYEVVKDKLIYLQRGTYHDIDGRLFACLGGAGSIDKAARLASNMHWSPGEQIRDEEVARLVNIFEMPIAAMLTHTPPQEYINKWFDISPIRSAYVRRCFGAPEDWFDPSAHKVQEAWEKLGRPQLFCGHMHVQKRDEQVMILDIDQLVLF